jgi:Caspase domain
MSSGPTPAPPWRDTAPAPAPPGHPWRTPPPRAPYRTRWWKLAGIAVVGLATLAAVTWAVFWIRPPEPARVVVLVAGYDNTLAVPPNPYGKSAAREFAALARPGGWLGTRSRLSGAADPQRFSRAGLPDLSHAREKCVVVVIAAHGGRDRDGAFLFPEDATAETAQRVRVKTLIEQLAKLPAKQQKLLILDATEPPAYPDLGLVHNDFAAAVEDLNGEIAAVPNLAVFMSTGPDQRSWTSPEWGQSSFTYHLVRGLKGAADANGDKRITGGELVDYVRPRVREWARDHRAALQTPVLLPKGDEGENRMRAMHLAMTDGPPPDEPAPTPFDPPPELDAAWAEYRELARAYVPPTAYTPHLWRQYEAWTLRFEQAVIAGDADGAKNARAKAGDLKRQIEAARRFDISPQTLALQAALGGLPVPAEVPDAFRLGIEQVASAPDAERPAAWAKVRDVPGFDSEVARLLWCRALIDWVRGHPPTRLPVVPSLVPLFTEGMPVRPAEVHFLLMVARHLPPQDKKVLPWPNPGYALLLRPQAERAAGCLQDEGYPYTEQVLRWATSQLTTADAGRRRVEDYCFATAVPHDPRPELSPDGEYRGAVTQASYLREFIVWWHTAADRLPAFAEWVARGPAADPADRAARDRLFHDRAGAWMPTNVLARSVDGLERKDWSAIHDPCYPAAYLTNELGKALARQADDLLKTKPEFEARPTPRADSVRWWQSADDVLTAPPPHAVTPARRVELVREFRRVSRQLLVTGRTRPEPLPEVSPEVTRERAFETARRRGLFLLARLDLDRLHRALDPPGRFGDIEFRLERFAFQADGRQSLAEAGSLLGSVLDELPATAEWYVRVAPAHAAVSDAPIDRLRRERVRAALAQQARRTYEDHWYGEGNTRYYRTAIEHLAGDARKLFPGPEPKDDPFKPYLGAETPFPLAAQLPKGFAFTDEPNPSIALTFAPQPTPGISGVPVFWAESPFAPAKPGPPERVAVPTDPPHGTITRAIPKPAGSPPTTPVAHEGAFRVTGFFRGRTAPTDAEVNVYPLPDRVAVTTPGLTSTAVAVRADPRIRARYGFGTGAVAIVLDCSGSLGPPDRKNPTDPGLYPEALKALRELLRELPPGTTVTVWVFGQRTPGARAAEETIREVLPPTALPYDTATVIKQVDDAVAVLDPWDYSPIVRTILAARDRIKDAPVPFKAVVLISDGVDNRWADDPANTAKRSVRDALRAEFPPAGVSLSVVALPVPKSEEAAQAQFQEVEKLKPAGLFITPDKVKDLAAWLRNGLNPRVRFTLFPLDGQGPPADLTAGTDATDNWYAGRLEPGAYRLRVSGAKDFAATLRLERGDRLLLDLSEDRGALSLARHWYADTAAGVKSGKPGDPWRLALLQNRSETGGLRLFAAVEERPTVADTTAVSRIGEVWFEVRPVVAAPGPVTARWRAAPGYPAPAWGIDIPGWPAFPGTKVAASPAVEAWWNPDGPFPAAGTWPLPAGKSVLDLKGEAVKVSDTTLTLESVSVEEHAVDVAPDGRREPRKCLVVRLSHPAGSPAWVRPAGATPAGSEVRVYRAANKVTCLFWGLDPAKVTGFEVVSLNDALKQAEKLGRHAKLDNAPGPTDASPRPEPPVEPR